MGGESTSKANRERYDTIIREWSERLLSVFEFAGAGMLITSDDVNIRYANPAFLQLLGWERADVIGRAVTNLTLGSVDPIHAAAANLRTNTTKTTSFECPFKHRDGRTVWVAVNLQIPQVPPEFSALTPPGETLTRLIWTVHDITPQKVTEALLRENQLLLEKAQRLGKTGHWIWDLAGNDFVWSDELYRITGLEPGRRDLSADSMRQLVIAEDRHLMDGAFGKLRSGQNGLTFDLRIVRKDGEPRHLVSTWVAERGVNGRMSRIVGTIQDITEHKQQEVALRNAMRKAEEANLAKTNFLASMSHELRTPLNAILGFAELLTLRTQGDLTEAQAGYVRNIMQGGEHLLRLINDVLDLARIDTGKLTLNLVPVEISVLIRDMLMDFKPMAEARGVTISYDGCAEDIGVVTADRTRLTQILVNLTSNAIKYNRHGGSVILHVHAPRPGWVRISVEDTGRGISAERHAEVFQSFNRLGAEATGEEGTGIGLSLSKRLIEEMGGAIGFSSARNEGSTFWIELPTGSKPEAIIPSQIHALAS